jgi:predicted secreted Zn-dependent protease
LPRHVAEATLHPLLLEAWKALESDVTIHEGRHVTILKEGLEEARRELLAVPPMNNCSDLEITLDRVWIEMQRSIDARQESFHIADQYGGGGLVVR